jgi:trimeric autotransporter adhesin
MNANLLRTIVGTLAFTLSAAASVVPPEPAPASQPIPWSEIGAKATAQYEGDGLSVLAREGGATLRCVFQKLEGEATPEGLWLTSTAAPLNPNPNLTLNPSTDRFRVRAVSVGRTAPEPPPGFGVRWQSEAATPLCPGDAMDQPTSQSGVARCFPPHSKVLPQRGEVAIDGQTVRYIRPGVIEEYSVSMDGVRQDFIVELPPLEPSERETSNIQHSTSNIEFGTLYPRPSTLNQLRIELEVSGARVEAAAHGVQLMLENSGRKIAYSRLHVTDATGRELPARMEVSEGARHSCRLDVAKDDAIENSPSAAEMATVKRPEGRAPMLAILVDDRDAVYPVRIDPTFSDENWISMGGIPGTWGVHVAVVDGLGNLYIGGDFTTVSGVIANRIAKWNGSSWSALGSGMNNQVRALAVSGNDLYAGGQFTTAGGVPANSVAKWDGSSWSALGSGMNRLSSVYALAVSGGDLYAGGNFTTATNASGVAVAVNRIAKWDGSSWSALGSGIGKIDPYGGINPYVYALAVSGSDLYVGGVFTNAGGVTANSIARWNGSSWSALGSGMNRLSSVYALAVSGGDLYAGGDFTTATNAGGAAVAVNRIAKWDGSSWSALGSGMNSTVGALAVSGGELYVGGDFFTPATNGIYVLRIYPILKWNGTSWSALGSGMNSRVAALAVSGTDVYAGGGFGPGLAWVGPRGIAKWGGSTWSNLGSGMNRFVRALAVSDSDLYVGGHFKTIGNLTVNGIAKWNGSSWSALGSGMAGYYGYAAEAPQPVYALAVSGSELYVGGDFTRATNTGGASVTVHNIARWDGSNWSALGSGVDSAVHALVVLGSDLYVGGVFTRATNAGGVVVTVNRIAKWNGSSWSALGSGVNNDVNALAVSGGDLYAGGNFTTAGGVMANAIGRWNGSGWSALGSGMARDDDGYILSVSALAVSGDDLYAGGGFLTAGGVTVNSIAKWNGSSWSALDSGMGRPDGVPPYVYALAVSGSDLYAGGSFTVAGSVSANRIAKWNGSSWSALGSGMNGRVHALAVSGSDLYAGGEFTTAGGKASAYLAKAQIILPANAVPPQFLDGDDFVVRFDGTPGVTYTIEFTPDTSPANWQKATNIIAPGTNQGLGEGVFEFRDNSTAAPHRFYRAAWPAY